MLFSDAKKAHRKPKCQADVYIELPEEAGGKPGECGKFDYWPYGFGPASQAWEEHYAEKLIGAGFVRGKSCSVIFHHPDKDLAQSMVMILNLWAGMKS